MNQKFTGVVAVIATWVFVVYLIVAAMTFWSSTQRDWDEISARVVARNLARSLLWIREFFR